MTVSWKLRILISAVPITAFLGACADNETNFRECDQPTAAEVEALPEKLSNTGLFTDMNTEELAPRVWPYQPQFELWSDGAKKRRWISIPEGAKIDTSDMDQWRFPVGTKLFKEFTRDGVRVETRMLLKTGVSDDAWSRSAYVWNADQSDAMLSLDGGVNQGGTGHDVPSSADCAGCHDGRASRVLGFSAVQLAWRPPEGKVTVAELKAAGVLGTNVIEELVLPSSSLDKKALGYLHANCSHCHNTSRPSQTGSRCYDPQENFNFSIPSSGVSTVQESPAYLTGIREEVLAPGNATQSELIRRLSQGNPRMPALGSEIIDQQGRALLTEWVDSL